MNIKDMIPGYNNLVLPYHYLQSLLAATKFGFPGKRLRIIGITGTNGKTTTSFMIWKMLNTAGHKCGLMTTVAWGVPGMKKPSSLSAGSFFDSENGLIHQSEHMTTVDPITLNRRIKTISDSGAEFLVLEVTSHALAQFRTLGLHFEIAVMTNVTQEHLDYHKTFENYRNAKCKLFRQASYGIVNADDPSAKYFTAALPNHFSSAYSQNAHANLESASANYHNKNYTSYGIKNGDNQIQALKLSASGVNYSLHDIKTNKSLKISTKIPGEFNAYNSAAAACVGKKLGLKNSEITTGIAALKEVEGRMNRLDFGQKYEVIVDFAHTPDAFEKVFSSVAEPKSTKQKSRSSAHPGRVISLFGGAGRRDESTRAKRGEIAGKYSDICILTEDDSRDEDPLKIIEDFKKGCKKAGLADNQILIIPDREAAIKKAISLTKPNDIVLILGKGHEKTILRADGPHSFEDLKITAAAIKSSLKK